ncbi:Holliday junction branch migration protein RuvA [Pseudofulvimonas gallinarii]|jgi:Holliday junction DNA helicase RuvA|uniref:Holliday junction branch migration complex subunit RuvA n=1 Tax=Pseudofulvimonas gallinarii TaxID=634155 RepID=A0A4R3LMS4_9GAMM|nr:Holliday junction branch migration protein RuvA [Pseudofulvimonas gallinarii]TCT00789.1 Holliday junction DNA helicase subunit RuvA [Pseudofulvimonas gallinarii]THD12825.1 Holliday junction branch migration protein RuvA [Pseudofulvimonas gallinarii]
MIGRLHGKLLYKHPPWLLLDVNGVGYELECPMSTFYELPEVGRETTLVTHYAVKEDAVALYGFHREAERALFRVLIKVSGVGAKTALSVLSGVTVDAFAALVQAGDTAALTRVPGIGKKTAERILVELRDKVSDLGSGSGVALPKGVAVPMDPESEAASALQALGYKPADALRMVRQAVEEGDDAEAIIRKALKAALKT